MLKQESNDNMSFQGQISCERLQLGKKGADYMKIFALVVKITTIQMVVIENRNVEQLNVKTTFLHGDLH